MTTPTKLLNRLDWLLQSVWFFTDHFFTIFGLGLVAALGRAAQLGAFGQLSSEWNVTLEVGVEGARVLIFLYTLGLTHVKTGVLKIAALFTNKRSRRRNWQLAVQKLRTQWATILLNLLAFSLLAFLINFLIDHIAYQTCLYTTLKAGEVISEQASVWTIILFFKNISVIPLTLIFNALFMLWLINRLPKPFAAQDVLIG